MNVLFDGPAGQLEAVLTPVDGATRAAVLCHPHPQMGGSMHDAVVGTAERVLLAAGVGCLRFNFRGVGRSEGAFDDGVGEVDDVATAVGFARTELAGEHLTLVGYSFGSVAAWQAAARVAVEALVLIAPPLVHVKLEGPAPSSSIGLAYGDRDTFISSDAVTVFGRDHPEATGRAVAGADHFFTGHHDALAAALTEIL